MSEQQRAIASRACSFVTKRPPGHLSGSRQTPKRHRHAVTGQYVPAKRGDKWPGWAPRQDAAGANVRRSSVGSIDDHRQRAIGLSWIAPMSIFHHEAKKIAKKDLNYTFAIVRSKPNDETRMPISLHGFSTMSGGGDPNPVSAAGAVFRRDRPIASDAAAWPTHRTPPVRTQYLKNATGSWVSNSIYLCHHVTCNKVSKHCYISRTPVRLDADRCCFFVASWFKFPKNPRHGA
jgi:hypothetical protein